LSLKKRGIAQDLKLEKLDSMEGRMKFMMDMQEIGVAHLEITRHLVDLESDETLKRLLRASTKCIVRIYMISAYDLASRDNGSFSDPYLILTCGNKIYNERSIYQNDEPNPFFGKHYDFESVFPGCAPLVINVMDYDEIFGDDSVGKTSIDLEDRFFTA
jgi:Ca2+-dependent lipid-binding protein